MIGAAALKMLSSQSCVKTIFCFFFKLFACLGSPVQHLCKKRPNSPSLWITIRPAKDLHFWLSTDRQTAIAPKICVDFFECSVKVARVDGRKGWHNNTELTQSRLGDRLGGATRWASRPEKSDVLCEDTLGFGTAKAVIASGAVTVHASTLLAPSQELVARA
jgi:hypothetical protein